MALLALICLAMPGGLVDAEPEICVCAQAQRSDGWCAVHAIGYLGGIEIVSAELFEVLDAHGHALDPNTFECSECRTALESGGFCETHRNGFVEGLTYFSRLTYELARAERRPPRHPACADCSAHARSYGWCERHAVGRVGPVVFEDRGVFRLVERAVRLVELANDAAERCEYCAVAIVTDTECPVCRVRYSDGRPETETVRDQ